jgi:hypothetical protein
MSQGLNVNGVWKTVAATYIKANGVWKTAQSISENAGGVWKNTSISMGTWSVLAATLPSEKGSLGAFGSSPTSCTFAGGNVGASGGWEQSSVHSLEGGTITTRSSLPSPMTQMGGLGTSKDSGMCVGGQYMGPNTNTWKFTGSWSTMSAYPVQVRDPSCVGTISSAISAAGDNVFGSSVAIPNAYYWDGSTWAYINPLPAARKYASLAGSVTSAVLGGGVNDSTAIYETYLFNGTTWSTGGNITIAFAGGCGSGPSSINALFCGDRQTQLWNGSSSTTLSIMTLALSSTKGTGGGSVNGLSCAGGVNWSTSPETYSANIQSFVS